MQTELPGHITDVVNDFLKIGDGDELYRTSRARSWDYCYTYFRRHPEPTRDMEMSCLQLGYYLASWGMLRGSSYLFAQTNVHHYTKAIRVIEDLDPTMRTIDADSYLKLDAQVAILNTYRELRAVLVPSTVSHVTLVGKVMLGVWGCIPSFDTYFRRGFRQLAADQGHKAAFNRVSPASLTLLGNFYEAHREEIGALAARQSMLTFEGKPTGIRLPLAKVIDMYGFQKGYTN